MSAFASDAQLSNVPVQILELKPGHFTRPQTEVCEQHHDRVVAPLGRGAPRHRGQQLAYGIRRNSAWGRRHRPARHHRHCGGQIEHDVTAIAYVLEEGPERGGQLLRLGDTQTRNLALDKSHDIVGTKPRQSDAPAAEPLREERADDSQVIAHGPIAHSARLSQVGLKRLNFLLDRGEPTWSALPWRDHTLIAQKCHELVQHGPVGAAHRPPTSPSFQVCAGMLGCDLARSDAVIPEPSTQASERPWWPRCRASAASGI